MISNFIYYPMHKMDPVYDEYLLRKIGSIHLDVHLDVFIKRMSALVFSQNRAVPKGKKLK